MPGTLVSFSCTLPMQGLLWLFSLFLISFCITIDGATVSWIGGSSGNWDDPTAWSNAKVPTADDDVTISNAFVNSFFVPAAAKNLSLVENVVLNVTTLDVSTLIVGSNINLNVENSFNITELLATSSSLANSQSCVFSSPNQNSTMTLLGPSTLNTRNVAFVCDITLVTESNLTLIGGGGFFSKFTIGENSSVIGITHEDTVQFSVSIYSLINNGVFELPDGGEVLISHELHSSPSLLHSDNPHFIINASSGFHLNTACLFHSDCVIESWKIIAEYDSDSANIWFDGVAMLDLQSVELPTTNGSIEFRYADILLKVDANTTTNVTLPLRSILQSSISPMDSDACITFTTYSTNVTGSNLTEIDIDSFFLLVSSGSFGPALSASRLGNITTASFSLETTAILECKSLLVSESVLLGGVLKANEIVIESGASIRAWYANVMGNVTLLPNVTIELEGRANGSAVMRVDGVFTAPQVNLDLLPVDIPVIALILFSNTSNVSVNATVTVMAQTCLDESVVLMAYPNTSNVTAILGSASCGVSKMNVTSDAVILYALETTQPPPTNTTITPAPHKMKIPLWAIVVGGIGTAVGVILAGSFIYTNCFLGREGYESLSNDD